MVSKDPSMDHGKFVIDIPKTNQFLQKELIPSINKSSYINQVVHNNIYDLIKLQTFIFSLAGVLSPVFGKSYKEVTDGYSELWRQINE